MKPQESQSEEPIVGRFQLKVNLARLRKLLEDIESELAAEGQLQPKENLAVARLEVSAATYVLTRIVTVLHKELSRRQHEVAVLLAKGWARKSIARELKMSVRTVDSHRDRIYAKLGVDSRVGLALWIPMLS